MMSTKFFIFDKIFFSNNVCKHTIQNSKYMKFKYDHKGKCFVVNVNNDIKQNTFSSDPSAKYARPLESHTFKVDRNIFIKEILNNFNETQPSQPNGKKIVLDFSSPNIAKPFHAGHLRSTVIGNFIANINTYLQNDVVKINYLGDWGTQFGILQYGLRSKQVDLSKFETDPIRRLYEIYVEASKMASNDENVQAEARKYFTNIEQGNTSLENWRKIREITVQELERVYNRLGINFDTYHWESDYNGNAIKEVIRILEEKKIITATEEGKKVAQFRGKDITVLKSDHSTLYLSRDIAALLDRYEKYKFDKMLYVVDNSQTDHFAAVFDIVKQINNKCANACEHVKFGRIKGMSTRTGNVVFLNDILDEAKHKMQEQQKASKNTRSSAMTDDTCDTLGITAVVINDLKQRRQRDYVFDWNKVLQTEGDSGIKLQYLHCRLFSLEQSSGVRIPNVCAPEYLTEEIVGDVVAELARYEDILHRAHIENEACIIVNYLFRLARQVNRMFKELNVKNEPNDVAAQRLLVFYTARKVVKTSLQILGVRPLNQM